MLRQVAVLGGRAAIPAALSLVLASPGYARAAEVGVGIPVASVTRAPAAAAAAPGMCSALHAGDPVSRRAEGPGHGATTKSGHGGGHGHAHGDEAPGSGHDAHCHEGAVPDVPEASPPTLDVEPRGENPAPPQQGASSVGPLAAVEQASGASSLPAHSGVTPPARIAIADALRLSSPLPILSMDKRAGGRLAAVSGRLRTSRSALRVEIALRRGGPRRGCSWWSAHRGQFTPASRAACGNPRWIRATMRRGQRAMRWHAPLGRSAPRGSFALLVRVLDRHDRPVDVERR